MFKWKDHKAKMTACLADMEALEGKIAEAQGKGDAGAEELKTHQAAYDGKVADFETMKQTAETQKAKAARVASLETLPEEGEGHTLPTVAAKATDQDKKANAHLETFVAYCQGKSLTGEQQELVKPKTKLQTAGKLQGAGAVMPVRMVQALFGKRWAGQMDMDWQVPQGMSEEMMAAKVMLSTDIAGAGGSGAASLFQTAFTPELQMLALDEANIMDKVSMAPATSGSVMWPKLVQSDGNELGGVVVEWLDEGAPKPETEPEFEDITIATHEVSAYTEISETLLRRSAVGLEALLATLFRGAVRLEIDRVIVSGTGTGQPLGIVQDATVRNRARLVAGAVSDADLVGLKHDIKPAHRNGASFIVADSVEESLEMAVDGQNRPLFRASTATGPYDRLTGYPYFVGTNSPALGTTGDVIYGNLRAYMLGVEAEVVVARSEHYQFRSNRVAFKVHAHVGGRAIQGRALVYLDDVDAS